MRRFRSVVTVVLLTSGALMPRVGQAQTLAGRVRDALSREPLAGIRALLVTDSGRVVAEDTSGRTGAFYLFAPKPGSFDLVFASNSGLLLGQGEAVAFFADSTLQKEYLLDIASVETAYTRQQVDRPAKERSIPRTALATSPRAAATPGRTTGRGDLRLQFVVDTMGVPEPATIKILAHADERYERAVLELVPSFRYEPAIKNGRPVRQIVEFGLGYRTRVVRVEAGARP